MERVADLQTVLGLKSETPRTMHKGAGIWKAENDLVKSVTRDVRFRTSLHYWLSF